MSQGRPGAGKHTEQESIIRRPEQESIIAWSHLTYTVKRLSSMRLTDRAVRGTPNVTRITVAGGVQSVAVQCGVEKPLRRRRVLDAGTGLPSTNDSVLPTILMATGCAMWARFKVSDVLVVTLLSMGRLAYTGVVLPNFGRPGRCSSFRGLWCDQMPVSRRILWPEARN